MVGPPFQDTGDGTQYKGSTMSITGGGFYREDDDRIGWCEASSNECKIDFWKGGGLEDSEQSLQTVDATWQAVLALSGSFLAVDFNH